MNFKRRVKKKVNEGYRMLRNQALRTGETAANPLFHELQSTWPRAVDQTLSLRNPLVCALIAMPSDHLCIQRTARLAFLYCAIFLLAT
jgi:hypothetical protein